MTPQMNPIAVGCIYGTAIVSAPLAFIVYAYQLYKQDKQNPLPPVKLSDHGDEKRLASATKHIKIICRD